MKPTLARVLIKNTFWNFFTQVWLILIFMVTTPVVVHNLGDEAYGILSLIMATVGYFGFLDFGISQATLKFISEHLARNERSQVHRIISTSVFFSLIVGLLGAAIIIFLAPCLIEFIFKIPPVLRNETKISFYIFSGWLIASLLQGALQTVPAALQRFDLINLINGIACSLQGLVSAWLVLSGFHLKEVVALYLIIRVLSASAFFIILFKLLPDITLRPMWHGPTFLKLFSFGKWVLVSYVIGPLMVNLDRFLIGSFISVAAVTYYAIPYAIITKLGIIPGSAAPVLFPTFSERGTLSDNSFLLGLFRRSLRLLNLSILPLAVILFIFADEILRIWMGVNFADKSVAVARILSFAVVVNGLAIIPYTLVQGLGRADITAKFHLCELPAYLLFCLFLIPSLGINGAAIAWTGRVVLDAALLFWYVRRRIGLRIRKHLCGEIKWGFLLGAVWTLLMLGIKFSTQRLLVQGALILLSLGLYASVVWLYILDDRDRMHFKCA